MLLNSAERVLMNNPVRALVQRHVEARVLLALGGPAPGRALEVGCGRGVGIELILGVFGASAVDAFDLDPRMVDLARARHADRGSVRVSVGDAEQIHAPDGTYDAVFDFGILHHVPDWRRALGEIARVLAPGGRLYAEEVYEPFLRNALVDRLFAHPASARFDHAQFQGEIRDRGLEVLGQRDLGVFGWVVARRTPL